MQQKAEIKGKARGTAKVEQKVPLFLSDTTFNIITQAAKFRLEC